MPACASKVVAAQAPAPQRPAYHPPSQTHSRGSLGNSWCRRWAASCDAWVTCTLPSFGGRSGSGRAAAAPAAPAAAAAVPPNPWLLAGRMGSGRGRGSGGCGGAGPVGSCSGGCAAALGEAGSVADSTPAVPNGSAGSRSAAAEVLLGAGRGGDSAAERTGYGEQMAVNSMDGMLVELRYAVHSAQSNSMIGMPTCSMLGTAAVLPAAPGRGGTKKAGPQPGGPIGMGAP